MNHVYFPATAIVSLLYEFENGSSAEIAVIGYEGVVGIALFTGWRYHAESGGSAKCGPCLSPEGTVAQKRSLTGPVIVAASAAALHSCHADPVLWATGMEMTRMLALCHEAEVECKTVPGLGEVIEGRALVGQIREVAVEDLSGGRRYVWKGEKSATLSKAKSCLSPAQRDRSAPNSADR